MVDWATGNDFYCNAYNNNYSGSNLKAIIAFLAIYGCHPQEPIMGYIAGLEQRGYHHYGKYYVKSKEDAATIVHDLYMECEQTKWGLPKDAEEWYENEAVARRIEVLWRAKNDR